MMKKFLQQHNKDYQSEQVGIKNENEPGNRMGDLVNNTKKIKKTTPKVERSKVKKQWNDQFVIIKIDPPQTITKEKFKKKYSIRITYLDDKKVRKVKTIMFGDKEKLDFIDDKDQARRLSRVKMLRHTDDPFHKDFWKLHLLNSKDNLGDAYAVLLRELNLL